jgi:hypothetical protein
MHRSWIYRLRIDAQTPPEMIIPGATPPDSGTFDQSIDERSPFTKLRRKDESV